MERNNTNNIKPFIPFCPQSCLTAAGVTVSIGSSLSEVVTKTEVIQTGTKPCECGYIWCARCPVFQQLEQQHNVYKRKALSLGNRVELHEWMTGQAVKRARVLIKSGREFENRVVETPFFGSGLSGGGNSVGQYDRELRSVRGSSEMEL